MAVCVCKCLNVILQSDTIEDNVDKEKLKLTSVEQRDIFFSEKLLLSQKPVKVEVAQPALSSERIVGRWVLYSCIACDLTTHAIEQDSIKLTLINKNILTNTNEINMLKKSSNYSPIFNILVPEVSNDVEMKENINNITVNNYEKKLMLPTQQAIANLNKQLSHNLQTQLEAVEETIRQFRDQKYAEFEVYREKAHREHKILAGIVSKTRNSLDIEGWRSDMGSENGPLSPHLPPLQRRRLSSFKDAKKYQQMNPRVHRSFAPEEDSLDVEDIFDLEGTDSNMSRNDFNSDQDDYDSDNSISRDEGIHIAHSGRNAQTQIDMARSCPINMPKFSNEHIPTRDLDDEEEPTDIAASIKALARSVHNDVYELPRPRFSTQI